MLPAPGTWMKVGTPERGKGPCFNGRGKHLRITYDSDRKLSYWMGGDYAGELGWPESSRQEVWAHDMNNPGMFELVTPYCSGQPQPSGPDEVCWVYDSRRKACWMMPGQCVDHTLKCPTSIYNRFMSFNPASYFWAIANRLEWGNAAGSHTDGAYDPITDTILQFGQDSNLTIYSVERDTRENVDFRAQFGRTIRLGRQNHTIDVEGRRLYGIDIESTRKALYVYNIETRTVEDLGLIPLNSHGAKIINDHVFWDRTNGVLYCVQAYQDEARVRLDVYHPDSKTFEFIGEDIDCGGVIARGVNATFDPDQNVLMLGGTNHLNPVPFWFLYRYAAPSAVEPPKVTEINVG